ncbi:MAG: hypothetical protein Q9221_006830 [Calogaya cf. arnoldii]
MGPATMVDFGSKSLSLGVEGTQSQLAEFGTSRLAEKHGLDLLLDAGLVVLDHRDERVASLSLNESVSSKVTKRSHPGLESLVLRGVDTRTWRKRIAPPGENPRNLKRLALVHCDNPMLMNWTRYPEEMESLEIVNPYQTYPYKAGVVLTDNLLAKPLSHFRHLTELNLQHIGAPICEVLFTLGVEAGKQLKVLKLHDQSVTGIDNNYSFQRHHPIGVLDCPLYKLLVYLCPNLEVLSLDVSNNAVEGKPPDILYRTPDTRSLAMEPCLEELQGEPSLPVFETLRSLQRLRSLRLVTSDTGNARSEKSSDIIASRTCSSDLVYFTLAVSASRPTDTFGNAEDVFRLDPDGASYLVCAPDLLRPVPRKDWFHRQRQKGL